MLIAEPIFIASLNGLCGFILVIEEERLTHTPRPASCWAYTTTAFKQPRRVLMRTEAPQEGLTAATN